MAFHIGSGGLQGEKNTFFSQISALVEMGSLCMVPEASLEVCQISSKPYALKLQE